MKSAEPSVSQTRLTQVYQYLQALDQLRNPVKMDISEQLWSLWLHDLPNHECVDIRRPNPNYTDVDPDAAGESEEADAEADTSSKETDASPSYFLRVRRPNLAECPEPPLFLKDWLKDGWRRVETHAEVIEAKKQVNDEGNQIVIQFEDNHERVQLLNEWLRQRDEWVTSELPNRQVMSIFERLYSLHNQMERESEQVELILGDGILSWNTPSGISVRHPILLQQVELHFDASIPEFTLAESDRGPEMYTALLRRVPDLPASAVSELLTELKEKTCHPLATDETSDYLKRVVTQISAHGELLEGPQAQMRNRKDPTIVRDPLLFLRKRTLGFSIALERILQHLQQDTTPPEAILKLIGLENNDAGVTSDTGETSRAIDVNGDDERVLLSKEANAEQLQIALRLDSNGAVLVQGPPGTGKTHTIANLLGHFLSQGKNVLVTSHTTKALRVLRDKVVKPLQPLCVSVLENDRDSRKQMEDSVDAIAERLSALDAEILDRQSIVLTKQRFDLLNSLQDLRNELRLARQDEYRPIVIAGESWDPSEAARKVSSEREENAWIPGPVEIGAPLPLSLQELSELYAANGELDKKAEHELHLHLPDPESLLPPEEFETLTQTRMELTEIGTDFKDDLWKAVPPSQTSDVLYHLLQESAKAAELIADTLPWQAAAVTAGKEGGALLSTWKDFIQEIESVYEQSIQSQTYLLKLGVQVSRELDLDTAKDAGDELVEHLRTGGKLSKIKLFTKRDWKQLIANAKVDGRPPSELEHFEAIQALIHLQIARDHLRGRWRRQMSNLGGPTVESLTEKPEQTARQFIHAIQEYLDWYPEKWSKFIASLEQQGLQTTSLLHEIEEILSEDAELIRMRKFLTESLPPVLESQANRRLWEETEKRMSELKAVAAESLATAPDSKVVQNLNNAVSDADAQAYARACQQLKTLYTLVNVHLRRNELLQKLASAAPTWAAAIRLRQGAHGLNMAPGDPNKAWLWRQLVQELDKRAHTSIDELQLKIADRSRKLREVTAKLVEKKAWSAQVRRTTLEQRQALQGWKLLIRKAGKGTGRRAPRLLAEARKLMPRCQTAVPVWIMPLNRVVENFVPGENHFDVVIIDEASQADVMALTGLYFGSKVLVVGDDEQVSPEAVGQRIDESQRLIDTYLTDVPNASIYDGKSSIYDLAKTSFPEVQLREHFRCVEPIIQFSNHLSYGGDIKPLRDATNVLRRPPTIAYRVEGGVSKNKVNEREAWAVASLLAAAAEHPVYEDATFGVISLLGDNQAMLIDSLLRQYLSAAEYQRHSIRCGNSAQFQGDERDVMFLSVVHSPSGEGPLSMLSDPENRTRKRFNVAASRARDQLWVVHSVDPHTDLKEGDLRKRIILHAEDPYRYDTLLEDRERQTESEFERLVLRRLMDAGYRVTPQWAVGAFRIDMVVEGDDKRLAVECDGDKWHPPEKLAEDMARQAILERLGWRFVRIRGSQFFRNPDHAMKPVFERLQSLDIPPKNNVQSEADVQRETNTGTTQAHSDFKNEKTEGWIIRRAAELRREWFKDDENVIGHWRQ